MPGEAYWESLFDVPLVLSRFDIGRYRDVAELGCGYGTFSIPIAKIIRGTLYTYDIDPAMVARTLQRGAGLRIVANVRDVTQHDLGVMVDATLLFNILHCEQPVELLQRAAAAGGEVLVTHWKHDVETPRGPAPDIRPRPDQIAAWASEAGLKSGDVIDLPPWHYGIALKQA